MTTDQLFVYLCINWNEEKVSIKPDTEDYNFAIETGAQFTAHFWVDKGQTSKLSTLLSYSFLLKS